MFPGFARLAYYWGYLPARLRMAYCEAKLLHQPPLPWPLVKYRKALLARHSRLYILHNKYNCWVITGYGKDGKPAGGGGFGMELRDAIQSFLINNVLNNSFSLTGSWNHYWIKALNDLGISDFMIKQARQTNNDLGKLL